MNDVTNIADHEADIDQLSTVAREHYEVAKGFEGVFDRRTFKDAYRRAYPERAEGSMIPSDYCHNRNNAGNTQHPRFLRHLGGNRYVFVGLNPSPSKALETIVSDYVRERSQSAYPGSMLPVFRQLETGMEQLPAITQREGVFVKAGFGQGQWADMPWLIVADSREADGPRRGVICTFKFPYDMSGVYVTLNQGIDLVINEQGGRRAARQVLRRQAESLRERASELADQGFHLDGAIDLRTNQGNHQADFEASTVAWKFYPAGSLPSDEQLNTDFEHLLAVYLREIEAGRLGQPASETGTAVSGLDPDGLAQMREDFLSAMAGFQSFSDPGRRYIEEERGYKTELAEAFQQEVQPWLAEPPETVERGEEICRRLFDLLQHRKLPSVNASQNLLNWRYYERLRQFSGEDALEAASLIHDLLHGEGATAERVERFARAYWPLLRARHGGQAQTRSLSTLLLMLSDPQREIFVLTSLFDDTALRLWGHRLFNSDEPMTAEDYKNVHRLADALWQALASWGWAPQDMIDVQSFMWVADRKRGGEEASKSPFRDALDPNSGRRIVKVAPGWDGVYWPECRDGGYVCVGWDEVGDLSAFSDADSERFPEYFRAAMGEQYTGSAAKQATGTRKAHELWTFSELVPGDIVVANKGTQEILAIGEVVDPGYAYREDRKAFKHVVYVRWDQSFAKRVDGLLSADERAQWGFTTVKELDREVLRALLDDTPAPPSSAPDEPLEDYRAPDLQQIVALVQKAGLRLSERTIRRYHFALSSRAFVILAGLSGTGKTWLAQEYARAVGAEHLIAPVAPNWTSDEDLLGFESPLTGEYQETDLSRFLRRAAGAYEAAIRHGVAPRPFHFILDEMNLARVEHYFARFLSAMEVRARDEVAGITLGRETVAMPPNFSFIGTINVDETTHGLADKVYDRAQLVEIDIDQEAFETHIQSQPYAEDLLELQRALNDVAPFAFRIADDISAYVDAAREQEIEWTEAFDEAVLHKLLPKVRGTDLAVQRALEAVCAHCAGRFPMSERKARRMLDGFMATGFASYF
jgi:MoxR-like ATPase